MINSRSLRNAVAAAMVVLLTAGSVWTAGAAEPTTDGLLRAIPAKSLFCVRINKLDSTLTAATEFLKGVAPESFDAKAAVVHSVLGKMLGDDNLTGVNTKRDFVVFGMNVPGDSPNPIPMGDMFIGALLPVRDYDNFISGSPNLSEPDDEGISTITIDGRPNGFATNFRRFALLGPPGSREKLIQVKELMGQRRQSLSNALDDNEKELAATSSGWIYLNVQEGSKLIGPMLFAQLEQMKVQLQKMKESGEGPPIDPSGIVNFYAGIFKVLIDGTEHVMIGLTPTSDKCDVTIGLKPVPGTDMAEIVGSAIEGNFENMLGYLDDGAMINLGGKIDRKSLKAAYMKLFELMGQMTTEGIPEEDLDKLKNLTVKAVDSLGDSLAMSFVVGGTGPSPFSVKYVIKISDEKAFKQILEEELKLMQDGALAKIYKGFGMEMDVEIDRDTGTYKGVKIDAAKVAFKIGDEDSLQNQMIKKILGDGLHYCWAFVDGYCVYSIGGETDKTIRELIDQVKAGGPEQIGSEMKTALEAIPNSKQADVVGTFNYVRILNMVSSFMAIPMGVNLQPINVPTESNVAFAGRTTTDGKLLVQMVLPKKHLLEIKSAFVTLISQIEQ
jgi:hypothetical protein